MNKKETKKQNKKQTRISNGEGSIFYREDKGLWCACVQTGLKRKTIYAKSQEELLEKKKRLEGEVVTGIYTEPSKMTVEEYVSHWLEEGCSNSIKPSTYKLYKGIIDKHITPIIGKTLINKVTPLQIQGLYNSKFKEGLSSSRVKHIHVILHKAFTQAMKWGMIQTNVTDLVDKPKVKKKEQTIWNPEQVRIFLKEAKKDRYYCQQ